MVDKCRSNNSSVFIRFIDASKAFDQVNHRKLFLKLSQGGVPKYIMRILVYWYAHQTMQVKWRNSVSALFGVTNGVRQGSIADIDEIMDYFLSNFKAIKSVMFFGGEPTLQSDKIIYTINKFLELKDNNYITEIPRFGLITNGVYFPEQLAKILAQINEGITLSVDGPMSIHDKLRPTVNNKGSFSQIKNTYNLLKANNISKINIETTYTNQHLEDNISFVELVKFFKEEFGCSVPHIVLVSIEEENSLSIIHNKDKLFTYLEELVDYTFETLLADSKINTTNILLGMIQKLVFNNSTEKICPAGLNTISIGADKKIQPCFMYTSDEEISVGTLNTDSQQLLNNIATFDKEINNKTKLVKCKNCFLKRSCSSCLGMFDITNYSVEPKSELSCEFFRKMAEFILLKLVEIKADELMWNKLIHKLR